MKTEESKWIFMESLPDVDVHYTSFGERLRQIRKEQNLSQDALAQMLGTTKQMLSRYELNLCSPRLEQVQKYAEKLRVPVDYLLGDTEAEAITNAFWNKKREKPFYKVFIDITAEMGLNIPGIVRVTGLSDSQVRTIIVRRMKIAPLDLAMQLSETLNVPLEIWLGIKEYKSAEISADAYCVARAYDQADFRDKNMARMALKLELLKEETV